MTAPQPPGWYPDEAGVTRYWDGTQWTASTQPAQVPVQATGSGGTDEKTMAMLAQLLGIFTGFLGPLVIYLVAKDDQPFVKHHAAESLNFQLTVLIGYIVSGILMFVCIGYFTFFALWIGAVVLGIMATMAANRGEWYRYPINIRMVPGAQG
ncbi:MAG: DUF4870 domain-containing protein [Microthrixaceae bacterium]|nr:DUF4870 domain-containing protein [Microthrixaceae bacterium]